MPVKNDFIGLKFGKLTPYLRIRIEGSAHFHWKCRCDCGNETIVRSNNLKNGKSKSCGCNADCDPEFLRLNKEGKFKSNLEKLKFRLLRKCKWNGECLEWQEDHSTERYGILKYNKTTIGAHRASWIVHKGKIPKGKWILHSCDNPLCVNPNHLFLGNAQENTDDMIKKGRSKYSGRPKSK